MVVVIFVVAAEQTIQDELASDACLSLHLSLHMHPHDVLFEITNNISRRQLVTIRYAFAEHPSLFKMLVIVIPFGQYAAYTNLSSRYTALL